MKLPTVPLTLIVLFSALVGCQTSPTVARYGMGDDSAAIKGSRNRQQAIVTDSELDQHRRQRANVAEEMDLEEKKRQRTLNNLATPADAVRRIGIGIPYVY